MKSRFFLLPAVFLCAAFLCPGCGNLRFPTEFQRDLGGSVLYAPSREAARGLLDFSARRLSLEIRLDPPLTLPPNSSLVLDYGLRVPLSGEALSFLFEKGELVLRCSSGAGVQEGSSVAEGVPEGAVFVLPWDGSAFPAQGVGGGAAFPRASPALRYAVPLLGDSLGVLSISLALGEEGRETLKALGKNTPVLELRSLEIVPRWYGLERDRRGLSLSPFVFATPRGLGLDIPVEFALPQGELLIRAADYVYVNLGLFSLEGPVLGGEFPLAPGLLPSIRRCLVEAEGLESLRLVSASPRPFPEPIPLDPALILDYPPSSWRRGDYEVFRWDSFPSLLIFDTASYAVQDRLFKRLAFFVEKAGYRGRLAVDEEIAGQHGWNAHDYRAADLARFFEAARLEAFPLLPEERELETLLLGASILRREGDRILPGGGGIISISRESEGYLRSLFMTHEGFHGIFFVDEDFREFSRRRWEALSPAARRFIISYFDYQRYDIGDEYLMINEFMAHVLQQPVSRAARYFGETLASRIEASSWRRTVLPEKDEAAGIWPALAEAFSAEARAFDGYVANRWGLGAGRVYRIRVKRFE